MSEWRVWRLCHLAGIQSTISTRKCCYRKAGPPVHDDLAKRDFTAQRPNQLWVTDITEDLIDCDGWRAVAAFWPHPNQNRHDPPDRGASQIP